MNTEARREFAAIWRRVQDLAYAAGAGEHASNDEVALMEAENALRAVAVRFGFEPDAPASSTEEVPF